MSPWSLSLRTVTPNTSAYSGSVPLIILLMFGERLKTVLGARVQQVRALEDLSSNFQHPWNSWTQHCTSITPGIGGEQKWNLWRWLVQRETLSEVMLRQKVVENNAQCPPLGSTHADTHYTTSALPPPQELSSSKTLVHEILFRKIWLNQSHWNESLRNTTRDLLNFWYMFQIIMNKLKCLCTDSQRNQLQS